MKSPALFTADGRSLPLDERVGKGGEGEVYAVAGTIDTVVKFYTLSDLKSREAKIKAMIAGGLAKASPLIAFPLSMVRDKNGGFAGFTMKRVREHQPLHELYSPGARKAAFPRADYRFLVRTAANISRAVAAAHSTSCVIGDINHSGILVSDNATAALIDADSFQISDGSVQHLCKVGVPEYTPPELQGQRLDTVLRTQNHDAFGLAVVIFQLLWMGRHPFSGRHQQRGEMPIEKAIAEFRFAYSRTRAVGMEPPPAVPILSEFPPPVGAAFEAAFGPSGVQQRPTAKQWIAILGELEQDLRSCSANSLHHYPRVANACPWCRMERIQGVQLFVPYFGGSAANSPTSNLSPTADVAAIWLAIKAVKPPPAGPFTPTLQTRAISPSSMAKAAKRANWLRRIFGVAVILGAVWVFLLSPSLWFLCLIGGGFGLGQLYANAEKNNALVENGRQAELRWLQALGEWQARADDTDFGNIKASLAALKAEIDALPNEEKKRVNAYSANRRSEHLRAYLDKFQIRRYSITGIGPSKLATLTSYGVETAADVSSSAVQRVPGFGPVNSQPLLEWRRQLEARFVYNASPTAGDRASINVIKAEVALKARDLTTRLRGGAGELAKAASVAQHRRSAPDSSLQWAHDQRQQAKVDLEHLGLKMPTVQLPQKPRNFVRPQPASHQPAHPVSGGATTTGQGVRCPQCSGAMVLRTAKRGRNPGRKFYGCARYPSCRGTRPSP